MGDRVIEVRVDDKIAYVVGDPLYVCGNSDYIVNFTFDADWADHEVKTARFIKNNKEYIDVIFSGSRCAVPIIENTTHVRIGVYAGNLCTTTAAIVNAQRSILCGSGTPANPPDDVYAQIMEHMDEIIANGTVSDDAIAGAVKDYLDENPVLGGATAEEAAQIEANKRAIEGLTPAKIGAANADHKHTADEVGALPSSYTPPVTSVNGQTGDVVIATGGGTAESVAWENVTGKPSTYPPDEHTHSYNDLSDTPEIPSLEGYATEDYVKSVYATKDDVSGLTKDEDLAAVAKSGNYNDLTVKPTCEDVGAASADHTHTATDVGAMSCTTLCGAAIYATGATIEFSQHLSNFNLLFGRVNYAGSGFVLRSGSDADPSWTFVSMYPYTANSVLAIVVIGFNTETQTYYVKTLRTITFSSESAVTVKEEEALNIGPIYGIKS